MTQSEKNDIYKQFNRKVFYYFFGKNVSEDDAEDLTANVFVKFFDKADDFDPSKSSPSTLIYRMAHNTLIDFWRVRKQHSALDEEIACDDTTLDAILNEETLNELAQALMRLGERERALIVLVYYDNKTLKESAEILKMSYSNAKIVMKKALEQLKDFLD